MFSVEEVMSTELHTLKPSNTLAEARALMAEKKIRHIPIVDDANALAGLVTQSDVLAAMDSSVNTASKAQRAQHDSTIKISQFMTTGVATVDPRTDLRNAARYLERHKHGCLPAVKNGKLVGIITDTDFVGVAINLMELLDEGEPPEGE